MATTSHPAPTPAAAPPPLIGLPGRRKHGRDVAGVIEAFADVEMDLYVAAYARSVIAAGGIPVHLPIDVPAEAVVDRLDGLLMTGGADIDPRRYGAAPAAGDDVDAHPEPLRDRLEFALLDAAAGADVPVLGICRGLQLLNVWAGGTLHQHVPSHAHIDTDPAELTHPVRFVHGTRVAALYEGFGVEAKVNSLHHQTIDRVGADVVVGARADDGTIEAIELASREMVAVQWHPEMIPRVEPIFAWLVDRAGARRLSR